MSGQTTSGPADAEPVYTLKEIARPLRVSTATLRRRIASGELDAFRVGRGLRVTESARDAYFERIGYKPQRAQVTT
jgi:excisionase family DNA binding protein